MSFLKSISIWKYFQNSIVQNKEYFLYFKKYESVKKSYVQEETAHETLSSFKKVSW